MQQETIKNNLSKNEFQPYDLKCKYVIRSGIVNVT